MKKIPMIIQKLRQKVRSSFSGFAYSPTSNLKPSTSHRGFTIVEMVIVAIIFSMIAGVVLYNVRQYSNNVSLESLTQDVALAIRNVQVEAVSGRYVGTAFDTAPSYGLYFDLSEDNTSFVHFADFNNNTIYDGDTDGCGVVPGNECLEVLTLQEGYTFSCIEATTLAGDTIDCDGEAIDTYAITFTRPESYPTSTNSQFDGYVQYADTQISIQNQAGETGTIHLWSTGQVEVSDGVAE
jgi:prepilin-type N-terminal cleavage/methylation domain-containing protein